MSRALWLGLAAAALVVQFLAEPPRESILRSALFDAGHAPLFGLVAFGVLRGSSAVAERTGRSRARTYLLVLAATAAAGGLSEIAQRFTSRDADPRDFARDVLGAAAALALASAFDRKLKFPGHGTRLPRPLPIVAAALLLVAALFHGCVVATAYLLRNADFPRICEFERRWEKTFVEARDATLVRTRPPAAWGRDSSRSAGRLTFQTAEYPGLLIREPCPDWTGYDRLVFEVYSELPSPFRLSLRIDDAESGNDYWNQYNRSFLIQPGGTQVSIPLSEVRDGPRARRMDLGQIRNVLLFSSRPSAPFSIWLDAVRLEHDGGDRGAKPAD